MDIVKKKWTLTNYDLLGENWVFWKTTTFSVVESEGADTNYSFIILDHKTQGGEKRKRKCNIEPEVEIRQRGVRS